MPLFGCYAATIEDHLAGVRVVGSWCCWRLPNKPKDTGYVDIRMNYKLVYAHRVFYEHLIRKVPRGLHMDHLCRNRWCCNPNHVEPVTVRENTLRGDTIPAMHARKTSCLRGHPFNRENTRFYGPDNRWRLCLICMRAKKED